MAEFLFYIEPFPIRNSHICFHPVPGNIQGALTAERNPEKYRIFANRQTFEIYTDRKFKYADYFIQPTESEDKLFNSHMTDWDTKGLPMWLDLMQESPVSRQYIDIIKNIHARAPFDNLVCWGTNYAVKQAAKELKTGFINMELGCSRTPYMDSLAADPWGVNGGAVFSKADISDLDFLDPSDANLDLLSCNGFHYGAYESKFSYMTDSRLINLTGNKKVSFITLQLYDDANMQKYSSYHSVKEVLEEILPKLADAGFTCIIKEHPATFLRKGADKANAEAETYAKSFSNVIWIKANTKNISNSKLYELSSLIITVNSSSGFEALFFNKPVVVLGEAVYKPAGCFPSLDDFLAGNFDEAAYRINIGKIRRFFLEDYLVPKTKAQNPKWFFNLLKFIGDMSHENLSAREIIYRYHEYSQKQSRRRA